MDTIIHDRICPFCKESIRFNAIKCRHCGEFLDGEGTAYRHTQPPRYMTEVRAQEWSPGIAALLSFIIPGAGQLYKNQIAAGILWFIFTGLGYILLIIPGLILHLFCIINAASGRPSQRY